MTRSAQARIAVYSTAQIIGRGDNTLAMRRSLPVNVEQERWNHNIHYHPLIIGTVPPGSERGLDVGCGEGILARELRRVIRHVVAIDLDEPSIDLARQQDAGAGIEYIHGDFLSYNFEPASFDVIVSVAALHHMETVSALERMRQLLRPGGKLAIIGLARSRCPVDLPIDLAGTLVHRVHKARKSYWEHCPDGVATTGDLRRNAPHRYRDASGGVVPPPPSLALLRHVDETRIGTMAISDPLGGSGRLPEQGTPACARRVWRNGSRRSGPGAGSLSRV